MKTTQIPFKIVQISYAQSFDTLAQVTIQHLMGLGNDNRAYEWDFNIGDWIPWQKP